VISSRMKAAFSLSAVALVAGQPFPFTLPPAPLTGACFRPQDPEAQCCVDPAAYPEACDGIARRFGPQSLSSVCCPSKAECCPTEFYAPGSGTSNQIVNQAPSFTCCDKDAGHACNLDTTTGKGVCATATDPATFTPMNTWTSVLDGEGRCSADGGLPLQNGPNRAYRCSVNVLLPFARGCPTDSVCTKDRQPNANSGVCCRTSHCQDHTTCQSCVTPLTKAQVDANAAADPKVDQQPVCSWLTQGDQFNVNPRCVTSCRNFPEKSCIVGGVSPIGADLCPNTNANQNGTDYNTGTCERRCGMVGTGRSSRINNNGNQWEPIEGHTTTDCCTKYSGDFCCDPYMGLAAHCTAGFVFEGPQCGVPKRGSPNNFFNTAPYAPPPYMSSGPTLWGSQGFAPQGPQFSPYGPQPFGPQPYGPQMGFGAYGGFQQQPGMYGGFGMQGGMYGGGFGMQQGGMYGGGFGMQGGMVGMYGWRSGEERATDSERNAFYTPQFFGPQFGPQFAPPPPQVPFWGPVNGEEMPNPSDQFASNYICSCDSGVGGCEAHDDCCSDFAIKCGPSAAPTAAPATN